MVFKILCDNIIISYNIIKRKQKFKIYMGIVDFFLKKNFNHLGKVNVNSLHFKEYEHLIPN